MKFMTMKTPWLQFIEDAVDSPRRGVACLNQQVLDAIQADPVGFYIYTDVYNYKNNKYKCGLSERGLRRLGEQAQQSEKIYIVDWIPSKLPLDDKKADQKIHKLLHEQDKSIWCHQMDKMNAPGKEWSIFPDNNPSELWFDALFGNITRQPLALTYWQNQAIRRLVESLSDGKKKIMAELAARFGKTTTYLALFDVLQTKVMVVGSYVLTVDSSFKKELYRFSQFENMELIDLSDVNFESKFNDLMTTDKQILVFASLCGSNTVKDNIQYLKQCEDRLVVIDEADYGAHTERKVPLVNELAGNCPCILTTGTNSERARGSHSNIDDFFQVSYFDMLMMRHRQ